MWQEVVTLFTAMEPIPAILLTVGIIFCIVEMFIPGIGFFGISGSISILAGIILRFINGFNLTQLFILVLILCIVFTIAGLIIVRSARKGLLSKTPLINNKTASAAEILAGVLKCSAGAILVGENTFGKNSIQQVIPMTNSTGMMLTSAKYILPDGADIHNEGIVPDYVVKSEDAMKEAIKLINQVVKKGK